MNGRGHARELDHAQALGRPQGPDPFQGLDRPQGPDHPQGPGPVQEPGGSRGADLPRTPGDPGPWDARSEEWLAPGGGAVATGEHPGEPAETSLAAYPGRPREAEPHGLRRRSAGPVPGARRAPVVAPRPTGDPVKTLMRRHRALCERAVDPLEIAAGLEAHGMTDRAAARFRHRDVFSLAEEMYARVPRDGESTVPGPAPDAGPGTPCTAWTLLCLLPGVLCAAAVLGVRLVEDRWQPAVAGLGVLTVALGLRAALRHGPLSGRGRGRTRRPATSARVWTCWLVAYALLGDGLLASALAGGPDRLPYGLGELLGGLTGTGAAGAWPVATASALALSFACVPAAWCAHLLTVRARRVLAASRGLAEFASAVRPLLLGAVALFVCALAASTALCAAVLDEPAEPAARVGACALGLLLLLARLCATHGFTRAPALVLAAAGTAEAAAVACVFAARLPGCGFLATPVRTAADTIGPGIVPAAVCGAAALVLLVHAARTLTRASAHAPSSGTP